MSLIVEISNVDNDVVGIDGVTKSLRSITSAIGNLFTSGNTQNVIKNTVCKGILQNDLDIGFTNTWNSNAYQGIMSGVEKTAASANTGTWGNWGKLAVGIIDFTQTAMNMGGMSLVGAGPASTKVYGGSDINGFKVSMKWYTPNDESYKDSIKAILVLGFPSYRNPQNNAPNNSSSVFSKIPGVSAIADTLGSLASYNPPPVRVSVRNSNNKLVFNLHPLVITNISFHTSRETCNGIPIVLGVDVDFVFYQIKGNNGYVGTEEQQFIIAGVSVLDEVTTTNKQPIIQSPLTDPNARTVAPKGLQANYDSLAAEKQAGNPNNLDPNWRTFSTITPAPSDNTNYSIKPPSK